MKQQLRSYIGRYLGLTMALLAPLSVKAADAVDVKLVAALPRSETHTGVLSHAGAVWVSVSSEVSGKFGTVDVYNATGASRIVSLDLGHSPIYIYPYSATSVLVVGKSSWPWKSHYTVIEKNGNTFSKKTTTFSESYLVDSFAGNPQELYFSEPGHAAVYRYQGGKMKEVMSNISGPGEMVLAGSKLWVIERRNFANGDEGLIMYDTKSGAMTRIFADAYRLGLSHIAYNAKTNLIAVTESGNNTLILLDATSGKVVDEVNVYEYPRGVVAYGKCFAVTGEENKAVTFIARNENQSVEVGAWDLSAAGEMLKKPQYLSVDNATGDLFVRSVYPCPTCVPNTQSSVFRASDSSKRAVKACFN